MKPGIAIKTTFEGAIRSEVRYWLSRPMVERISAVEIIRRATFGIYRDAAPARMVRVSKRVDDLRTNKLAAGRPKDLLDVALLDELALAKPRRRRAVPSSTKAGAKRESSAKRKPISRR